MKGKKDRPLSSDLTMRKVREKITRSIVKDHGITDAVIRMGASHKTLHHERQRDFS